MKPSPQLISTFLASPHSTLQLINATAQVKRAAGAAREAASQLSYPLHGGWALDVLASLLQFFPSVFWFFFCFVMFSPHISTVDLCSLYAILPRQNAAVSFHCQLAITRSAGWLLHSMAVISFVFITAELLQFVYFRVLKRSISVRPNRRQPAQMNSVKRHDSDMLEYECRCMCVCVGVSRPRRSAYPICM